MSGQAPTRRHYPARALPMVGWVMVSRDEIDKAQKLLLGDQEGVVDELGLLLVHQAVADRLFPGTSVLHTRLRYVLFVPWLMRVAAEANDPAKRLSDLEFDLTGQLVRSIGHDKVARKGIIGGKLYPNKRAAQPASYAYWTALSQWQILGREYLRSNLSRDQVLRELASAPLASHGLDAEGQPINDTPVPFSAVPPMPDALLELSSRVTFRLEEDEKRFIQPRLTAIKAPLLKPDEAVRQSLLGALAERYLTIDERQPPWTQEAVVRRARHDDKRMLEVAQGLSALGGLARAAYAAMVETACQDIRASTSQRHRGWLAAMKAEAKKAALELDVDEVTELRLVKKDELVVGLLRITQSWVQGSVSLDELKAEYARIEEARKGDRARLSGKRGAAAHLREWARHGDETKLAEPLHFRWAKVAALLRDLHAKN